MIFRCSDIEDYFSVTETLHFIARWGKTTGATPTFVCASLNFSCHMTESKGREGTFLATQHLFVIVNPPVWVSHAIIN